MVNNINCQRWFRWMCYFYIVKSTGKRNVKQLSGDTLFMELSQFKNWLVVLGNADLSKYLLLTEIFGNQSNYCYFCRVANIFWSTNWWLGKLWGSSRSSVKTRWLRRWLGVRSLWWWHLQLALEFQDLCSVGIVVKAITLLSNCPHNYQIPITQCLGKLPPRSTE